VVLLSLSFDVAVTLPFPWVTRALHSLAKLHRSWMGPGADAATSGRLQRAASSLLRDSFLTRACLLLTPKEAAVSALALAARITIGADVPAPFLEQHASSAAASLFARAVLEPADTPPEDAAAPDRPPQEAAAARAADGAATVEEDGLPPPPGRAAGAGEDGLPPPPGRAAGAGEDGLPPPPGAAPLPKRQRRAGAV